jgi:hypothetical protein
MRAAQTTVKDSMRLRDSAAVSRAESETFRKAARQSRHRRSLSDVSGGCPVCSFAIAPGDGVSFQRGQLIHLACYEGRRASGGA